MTEKSQADCFFNPVEMGIIMIVVLLPVLSSLAARRPGRRDRARAEAGQPYLVY